MLGSTALPAVVPHCCSHQAVLQVSGITARQQCMSIWLPLVYYVAPLGEPLLLFMSGLHYSCPSRSPACPGIFISADAGCHAVAGLNDPL